MNTGTPIDTWKTIQERTRDALKAHFPIETKNRALILHDVHIDEEGVHSDDIRSQEIAKNTKRTWGAPVYGDISLVDKTTGKTIDRTKMKLLTLPKPTNRYSYIVDGGERQVGSLWLLRSGVYSHIKQNGEIQSEFNLAQPFAKENRIYIPFDPEKKAFAFKYGTAQLPLYSMLKATGVTDEDMKKAWGEDIYKANAFGQEKVEKGITDFYEKRLMKRGVRAETKGYQGIVDAIGAELDKTKLLPDTTKAALGKSFTQVNGEALLLASKRALGVARGEHAPEDRDSLIFKELRGVDDFLHGKLTHPNTLKTVKQKALNNLDRQAKVRDILHGEMFGKPVREVFNSSSLSMNPDQINPLSIMSDHRSTTILGEKEGGIKSEHTITKEMKAINPSHMGFLDPIHTPEGSRVGVTLHLPIGVRKMGNQAQCIAYDLKEHKVTWVPPTEMHTSHIVLPDQVTWGKDQKPKPIGDLVKMKDPTTHEIVEKPFKDGRYLLINGHQLFNETTNLIPFLQNDHGTRAAMAARQATQAVSLAHREQPLVQVKTAGPKTWEQVVGEHWAHQSPINGVIHEIKKDPQNGMPNAIVVKAPDGKKHDVQIYNNFPLNDSKTYIHATPNVVVGDKVTKGQVVADTNFTKDGHLALGTNLRVGYLAYKGYNFNDGIVISESAAKKLSSEHLHRHSVEIDPTTDHLSKSKFIAYASSQSKKFSKEQADKLGEDGVVQVGQKVNPGDTLIAMVGKSNISAEAQRVIGRLDKKLFNLQDKSVTWDAQYPGEVTRVIKDPGGKSATVYVKTIEPATIGDKIVGRQANKAIITKILPDHEMPKIGGPDGTHIELLMNPSGVPSRINLGQVLETAASKIARKTGQPYLIQNFAGAKLDYTQKVKDDLKKHGLSDTDPVFDAQTGRKLGEVLTGDQYIYKLKHQIEKKERVRSHTQGYTLDHAPLGTGAEHPGQAIGQLEFYSMLAHGAKHNLREMATYKSDQQMDEVFNERAHIDFWDRVRTGRPLPAPKPTFAYKKFETLLTGLGINIKKEGHELQLQPLTDKGVLKMSSGEIKDPGRVLRGKDAKELEKGLFDLKVTGGMPNDVGKGLKWSHITLAEPIPNPLFVGENKQHPGPAVVLSGLKFDDFEQVVQGKQKINGMTGGQAIEHLLKQVDVKKELAKTREQLPKLHGTELDRANRKAKYLIALDQLQMKPHEAYIMNHVPVIPPRFRPIVPMADGNLRFDDVNMLYKNLGHINNKLKDPIKELPDEENQHLREQMWDAMRALQGLGGKPVYDSNRPLKGILDNIAGNTPKEGYFQSKIMKRRQELSMRSTIIPEPAMHIDHIGLPKDAAMELYKPFVVREMGRMGIDQVQARKHLKEQTPTAWGALQRAMDERPVLLKRDPALHKFNIMAYKPKLVEGKAIQIHPLVTAGYNADFDGDTMAAYVPLTEEAVREAHKMLPSNNLFSPTNYGAMHVPEQEGVLGIHLLSRWGKQSGKSFSTFDEALKAKDAGKLHPTDVFKIAGKETTLGRLLIAQHLPDSIKRDPKFVAALQNPKMTFTKSTKEENHQIGVVDLLERVAKEHPKDFPQVARHIEDLGNNYSYELGHSISIHDLDPQKQLRDPIIHRADTAANKIKASGLAPAQKHEQIVDIYNKATNELDDAHKKHFNAHPNGLWDMVSSGARGKMPEFRQMNIAPMLVKDSSGRTLINPVKKSYAEGLDTGDYWTTLQGARMGQVMRSISTAEPGALTKEMVNITAPSVIALHDCGTSQGISMGLHHDDVQDRVLATGIRVGGKEIALAGAIVTPEMTSLLKKHKIDQVIVRSPLKCQHGQGICSKCYGLNEDGRFHEVGTNIGVIASQAMGEPATQLSMDAFHSGGVAVSRGGGAANKLTRLKQLLEVNKTLPNQATLAGFTGKVQKVELDKATNGWNVHINNERHYIQPQLLPSVKAGDEVKKGQVLSSGFVNPHKLLDLTDIHTVQNYLADELHDSVYKGEGVKRRNIETVVRSMTNLTHVSDPGHSTHLPGDVGLRTVIEQHNRGLVSGEDPIKHKPILRSAQQVALDQHEDWMARLNFQRLKQTVLEGAAKGWKTDLHSSNPFPAYAHGAEFGRGTPAKPHNF